MQEKLRVGGEKLKKGIMGRKSVEKEDCRRKGERLKESVKENVASMKENGWRRTGEKLKRVIFGTGERMKKRTDCEKLRRQKENGEIEIKKV